MKKSSSFLIVLLAVGLIFSLCACDVIVLRDQNEKNPNNTQESGAPTGTDPVVLEETNPVTPE